MLMNNADLVNKAREVLNPRVLSSMEAEAAGVGAALVTDQGRVYTGACIDIPCGMGFCAEHSAIASMITQGESKIKKIVAVDWDGSILAPCGRCRELIYLVHDDNFKTQILMPGEKVMPLSALLPFHWQEKQEKEEEEKAL